LASGITFKLKESPVRWGFFEVVKLVGAHFNRIDLTGLQSTFDLLGIQGIGQGKT
jgi:hypothetical protein